VDFVDHVVGATRAFLGGLGGDQARLACQRFDDHDRRDWAYWPTPRQGVPLSALDRTQSKAAHRLLAAMLPLPAYARAVTIMGLDEVLDRMEDYRSDRRHRGDYWITVFDCPGADRWAVRFEGHHVSLHATISAGQARLTPLFLGANPAVVDDAARAVVAPFGPEEQLGFELLHALSIEQHASAVIADLAPRDIVTRNLPRLERPLPPDGVPLAALAGAAAVCAEALLSVYLGRFADGVLRPDPRHAVFAWAGGSEPGTGHYYRIAGPRLLIELDNTQDGANHVHTVVRDPVADFGDDVLAAHYRHGAGHDQAEREAGRAV